MLAFSGVTWLTSLLAGFLGALTGLGGGVVLVPVLVLLLGVDLRYAVGASLIAVIATSSGAASAYVREGFTNLRIAMFLEIATSVGAVAGALVATHLPAAAVAVIFGLVLVYSALAPQPPDPDPSAAAPPSRLAGWLRLDGTYPALRGPRAYRVAHIPAGFGMMLVAGILSGLLGIGSGAFKVLAMDRVMRIPFKVSTTTSNFMIGVTAAASAGIYLSRGYVNPVLAMPIVLGVLPGALLGTRVLARTPTRALRRVFAVVILVLAVEMIYHGVTGRI